MKADRERAEEILQKHGGIRGIYDKDIVIDAMLEFASFPVVTDEEIINKLKKQLTVLRYTKEDINELGLSNEYIDGWDTCINHLFRWVALQPVGKTEQLKEKTKGE